MLIEQEREKLRAKREASQDRQKVNAASAIIIGNELNNPDPVSIIDFRIEKKNCSFTYIFIKCFTPYRI